MTTSGMGSVDPQETAALAGGRVPTGQSKQKDAKLFKAAQEFEAFFVSYVMKQMRQAVPQNSLLHSKGEDTFRDMLDDQVGQDIAQGRGFGLADQLYRQLSLDEKKGQPGQ